MFKKIKENKGFTLIELLVVIAIIGILASVVLVSLQSARKKGNDARVMSNVTQLRTLIESSYNANNAYSDLTGTTRVFSQPTTGNLDILVDDIIAQQNAGGLTASYGASSSGTVVITKTIDNPGRGFAIYARLPGGASYFCIDSTGNTKNNATFPTSAPSSDSTASNCQ